MTATLAEPTVLQERAAEALALEFDCASGPVVTDETGQATVTCVERFECAPVKRTLVVLDGDGNTVKRYRVL